MTQHDHSHEHHEPHDHPHVDPQDRHHDEEHPHHHHHHKRFAWTQKHTAMAILAGVALLAMAMYVIYFGGELWGSRQ